MDQRGLVERARWGDHDAFTELARGAATRLDGAARLILRDPELARDAVQEALIRAWRDLPRVRGSDLYLANPVAGGTRLLLGGPDYDTGPEYSQDGTLVGFLRAAGGVDVDLYTMHDDGTAITKVSPTPLTDVVNAFWVPSSRYIAADHVVGGKRLLELFDVTGKEPPRELAAGYVPDNVVFRPPDAREIAFRGIVDGKLGLFVMNADGTNIRPLIAPTMDQSMDQHLNGLAYTADGARILYQHGVDATADAEGGCCELWTMNADGTDQHRFDPQAEPGQAGVPGTSWGGGASVSPDGRWVAYWHVFADQPTQRVSVVRADGTGPVIQTGPELDGTAWWTWSPDSTKILLSPRATRSATSTCSTHTAGRIRRCHGRRDPTRTTNASHRDQRLTSSWRPTHATFKKG